MIFRPVTEKDSEGIRAVYKPYIKTPITFEYTLPSETEFRQRVAKISAFYPYLVCEDEGRIVGYAYAGRYRERKAYDWSVELSVYLDPEYTGQGLGKKLYQMLMAILARQGIKTVYGAITLPNSASERLHESLGFHKLGVYRNTGFKDGQWYSVIWYEKELAPYDNPPKPVKSIAEVGYLVND
ncbi:N-acetyltransferase family protein [Lachnospiraceae bacterium OttesenSCG-928-J05]|nr:N-acetyltransferase family protein [Lachnospiraceae bacterium OttesenSCG-928-J05]